MVIGVIAGVGRRVAASAMQIVVLVAMLASAPMLVGTAVAAEPGDFCFITGTQPGEIGSDGVTCGAPAEPYIPGDQCGTTGDFFFNGAANACFANNTSCTVGGVNGYYLNGSCTVSAPTPPTPAVSGAFAVDPNAGAAPAGTQQTMCVNASPFIGGGVFVVSGTVLCYTGAGRNTGIFAYTDNGADSQDWNPFNQSTWDSINLRDLYASDDITALGTLSAFGGAQLYSENGRNGMQINDTGVLVRADDGAGSASSLSMTGTGGIDLVGKVLDGGPAISISGQIGPDSDARIGVVISGDGQGSQAAPTNGPANWADVVMASKSFTLSNGLGSGVIVNDYGVTIRSAATGNSYNSFGGAGAAGSTVHNDIGTGDNGGATINRIGNNNAATQVISQAGSSSTTVINGALDFATGNGTSTIGGATQQVAGGQATSMAGAESRHIVTDANGRMTVINGVASEASSSMYITNGNGITNGMSVNERTASISGGETNPTALTFSDTGAHFSNSSTGGPVRVSGVADGQGPFESANIRQLHSGLASVAALAGLPAPQAGKSNSLGVAMGQYGSGTALALGGQSTFGDALTVKYGGAVAYSSGLVDATASVGVGMSW